MTVGLSIHCSTDFYTVLNTEVIEPELDQGDQGLKLTVRHLHCEAVTLSCLLRPPTALLHGRTLLGGIEDCAAAHMYVECIKTLSFVSPEIIQCTASTRSPFCTDIITHTCVTALCLAHICLICSLQQCQLSRQWYEPVWVLCVQRCDTRSSNHLTCPNRQRS